MDKGRSTVLVDRDEYDKKLQDMLDDTKVYRIPKKDPSPVLERKMNSSLLDLKRKREPPDPSSTVC